MPFGICPHMSHRPKFWHTYMITYNNFMVIVEPWSVITNKPRDFRKSKLALNGFELNKILLSGTILEGKQTTHNSRWPVYFIKSWKLIWSVFLMFLTWKRFLKERGWQFTYILLKKVLNYTFSWIRQKSLGLHRTP